MISAVALTVACGGSARSGGQDAGASSPAAAAAGSGMAGGSRLACATPDDSTGTSISGTFRTRPEPIYAAGAAALRELGYAVLENLPPRELITAPSYAWPAGTANEPWHGPEHPGVEVMLFTHAISDSTTVTITARALCRVAGPAGGARDSAVGTALEGVVTLTAMNALINRLRTAPPQ